MRRTCDVNASFGVERSLIVTGVGTAEDVKWGHHPARSWFLRSDESGQEEEGENNKDEDKCNSPGVSPRVDSRLEDHLIDAKGQIILVAAVFYVFSVLFGTVSGLVRQLFPGRHLEA